MIGPYGGNLKNSGERLTLLDAAGNTVVDFIYSDRGDWPAAGDGTGHSIVLDDPGHDPGRGRHWRAQPVQGRLARRGRPLPTPTPPGRL